MRRVDFNFPQMRAYFMANSIVSLFFSSFCSFSSKTSFIASNVTNNPFTLVDVLNSFGVRKSKNFWDKPNLLLFVLQYVIIQGIINVCRRQFIIYHNLLRHCSEWILGSLGWGLGGTPILYYSSVACLTPANGLSLSLSLSPLERESGWGDSGGKRTRIRLYLLLRDADSSAQETSSCVSILISMF